MSNSTGCPLSKNGSCIGSPQQPTAEQIEFSIIWMRIATIEYVLHGLSFSSVYVSIILLFFLKLRCTVKLFLHKQLLISYLLTEVAYFSQASDVRYHATAYPKICFAFVVIVNYVNINLFTNMLTEGLYICIKLLSVFDTQSKRRQCLIYGTVAWGTPAVIVGAELAVWHKSYSRSDRCQFQQDDIWLYKAPVVAILSVNLINCVYILYTSITRICIMKQYNNNLQKTIGAIRTMMVLYPLLGLTFGIGFLININEFVSSYIYVVLNGSIGMVFFVFHILYDNAIRKAILKEIFGQNVSNGASTMATIRTTAASHNNNQSLHLTSLKGGKGKDFPKLGIRLENCGFADKE